MLSLPSYDAPSWFFLFFVPRDGAISAVCFKVCVSLGGVFPSPQQSDVMPHPGFFTLTSLPLPFHFNIPHNLPACLLVVPDTLSFPWPRAFDQPRTVDPGRTVMLSACKNSPNKRVRFLEPPLRPYFMAGFSPLGGFP